MMIGKTVYNLSDRDLSVPELLVLEKGLKFAVISKKLPILETKVAIEDFARKLSIRDQVIKNKTEPPVIAEKLEKFRFTDPTAWNFPPKKFVNKVLKSSFQYFGAKFHELVINSRPPPPNLPREQRLAIRTLRDDKNIKVLPADKGNAVVVINMEDYNDKMRQILNDPLHFAVLPENPTKKREDLLNKFLLRKLRQPDIISQRLHSFLRASDSRTPQLYGLVKVHKDGYPLRPIMSAYGAFNYHVGKLLVWILAPYMSNCSSFIRNSADFASQITQQRPGYSRLVSFDVKSLFTMVPVREAVNLALELIKKDEDSRNWIPLEHLHKLFEFSTSFCNFQFDGVDYDQTDGLSMGNPLAPPLAHLFMVQIENSALNTAIQNERNFKFQPLWWKRWVDDIFARITKRDFERLSNIVDFLNSLHESIQFTVETESSGALPFLEVKVSATSRRNGNYETSVYRKPTHTNQYVQWDSAHPPSQKIGIFRTLLTRAKRICSPANYNSEKSNLIEIFAQNGYPRNQLVKEIWKFENTQQQPNPRENEDSVILSIPYVPGFSDTQQTLEKNCRPL